MSILTTLVGPIANLAKGYLSNKAEEKQAKHQAKMSIIQNDADVSDTRVHGWLRYCC